MNLNISRLRHHPKMTGCTDLGLEVVDEERGLNSGIFSVERSHCQTSIFVCTFISIRYHGGCSPLILRLWKC